MSPGGAAWSSRTVPSTAPAATTPVSAGGPVGRGASRPLTLTPPTVSPGTMATIRHADQPPQVQALLRALLDRDVRCVLVGSVAAHFHGVDVMPGDLDVTPALDAANLSRLAELLDDLQASPASLGDWTLDDAGERRWIERPTTADVLLAWRPDVSDPASFDHLFRTRLGNFDVVPDLAGSYEQLRSRAVERSHAGLPVWVAHVDDLLARLTVPRRPKDRERVEGLRRVQREA